MASYVSIIEDSTQGRLLLGSLLSAGHYKVETVSLEDCPSARSNVAPNLIIVGPSFAEPEKVLEMISRSGLSAGVPVLVLARFLDAAKRLKLILKGAREVLEYPLTDSLLLARIRTLLREADAFKEIRRRRSQLDLINL